MLQVLVRSLQRRINDRMLRRYTAGVDVARDDLALPGTGSEVTACTQGCGLRWPQRRHRAIRVTMCLTGNVLLSNADEQQQSPHAHHHKLCSLW